MLLTNRLWWSKNNRFILSLGLKKKENRIVLQFLIVQLSQEILENQTLFQSYYNNYLSDRNNLYFLKNLANVTTVFKQDYKFEDIKMILESLKRLYDKDKQEIQLDFGNGITIIIENGEFYDLIVFVESYYKNYNIIDAMCRLMLQNVTDQQNMETKDSSLKINISKLEVAEKKDNVEIPNKVETEEELEYLLNLPFIAKQFLIHIFLTYCIYLDQENLAVNISENYIEIINPFKVIEKYNLNFESLFVFRILELIPICIKQVDYEIATYSIKEIINNLIDKYRNNISIQLLLILQLFIFSLIKSFHDNQSKESYNYVINNLNQVINNENDLLTKFLNYCIAKCNCSRKISIKNIDSVNINNIDINIEKLNELIKKHDHLKMIDEEKFVEAVLKDYDKKDDDKRRDLIRLNIGETKIIDIDKIINENNKTIQPTIIINESLTSKNDLLCYKNDEYITELFKEYQDYIRDETSILVKINDEKVDSTRKSIYKAFPLIKQFIENNSIFNSKLKSTLDLYIELTRSTEFRDLCKVLTKNRLLLIIIYQIFIPYFYHVFGQKQFVDNLL